MSTDPGPHISDIGEFWASDCESDHRALVGRAHYFSTRLYVLAVTDGPDDSYRYLATTLDVSTGTALRDALTAWLATQTRPPADDGHR